LEATPPTLLMIDDDPLMTELFRQFMTRQGFRVLTATSGQAGLDTIAAESGAVKLVITDMMMPLMDGIEIAQILAQRQPDLPVLIATGHDAESAGTSLPPNVVGIVQKPYQNRVLAERIREILRASASPSS